MVNDPKIGQVPVAEGYGPDPDNPIEYPTTLQQGKKRKSDIVLRGLTSLAGLSILALLGLLLLVLFSGSWKSITETGTAFLYSDEWVPNERAVLVRDDAGEVVFDENDEPVRRTIPPVFGAAAAIYGTAVTSIIALLVAVPFSFGAAIFLVRIAPQKIVPPVSFLVEFLAAIPSIAYGIWGLFVLAPFLRGRVEVFSILSWLPDVPGFGWLFFEGPNNAGETVTFFKGIEPLLIELFTYTVIVEEYGYEMEKQVPYNGFGWLVSREVPFGEGREVIFPTGLDILAGGLILAIMIIPIITAISRDVLKAVPRAQIEGTFALGATWWQSVAESLRYSRSALFGAVMLGLARAAGETMAITLVIGGNLQIIPSPFAAAETMSSLLANQFAEAAIGTTHLSALFEVALILLLMSLAFNIVARYFVVGKGARTSAAH